MNTSLLVLTLVFFCVDSLILTFRTWAWNPAIKYMTSLQLFKIFLLPTKGHVAFVNIKFSSFDSSAMKTWKGS